MLKGLNLVPFGSGAERQMCDNGVGGRAMYPAEQKLSQGRFMGGQGVV